MTEPGAEPFADRFVALIFEGMNKPLGAPFLMVMEQRCAKFKWQATIKFIQKCWVTSFVVSG